MASDRHCLASIEKGSPNNDAVMVGRTDTANSDGWGGLCVFTSVSVYARACMHACVRDVFGIYDNDILPMLIMIIINIISYNTGLVHSYLKLPASVGHRPEGL